MNFKRILAGIGLVLGLAQGIYAIVMAYTLVPSRPSVFEVLVQLINVFILILFYGVIGFAIGAVADKLRTRSK